MLGLNKFINGKMERKKKVNTMKLLFSKTWWGSKETK
jgi:hypothetical protein